jgi:hypothetical protein
MIGMPKTPEELMLFSECINVSLRLHGAAWAKYILFDNSGAPVMSIDSEFK